jgi:hypothetical protein
MLQAKLLLLPGFYGATVVCDCSARSSCKYCEGKTNDDNYYDS